MKPFFNNTNIIIDYHWLPHRKCVVNTIIAWIFGEGKPWRIWQITSGSTNFTIQLLTIFCNINKKANKQEFTKFYWPKDSDENFAKVFLRQKSTLHGRSYIAAIQHHAVTMYKLSSTLTVTVLEITVGHWPFSNQFQHLANQNSFWSAVHFQWDNN